MYESITAEISTSMDEGSITVDCDFTNSGIYDSYITDKTIPEDFYALVDITLSTTNTIPSGSSMIITTKNN